MQRGSLIDGRYTLGELLGSGGMGRVYRAYDGRLQREVALKVMAEHHAQTREFVERFEREIRNVASLDHPNVIRVFDSGEAEDGSPYMAMELASGGTLKDRIRSTGPVPPREAARVVLRVAAALGAAHEAGIVHRDVKPENVLLTESGDVKVADFGIARATEATAMTHTSLILGTAPYLSPEQARGEPLGPSSDLYSLGVVLYESLTGRTPFGTGEHLNPLAIAMKHCNEPAPSPRAENRRVPEVLESITLTLMRKRPEERYPDAATLATDLAAFLEGRRLSSAAALRVVSSSKDARTSVLRRAPVPSYRPRRRKVLPLMALALAAVLALFASSPAQMQRPVAFVERTIAPDAPALDRAARPALGGHPGAPKAPEEERAEAPRDEPPKEDPAPAETALPSPSDAGVENAPAENAPAENAPAENAPAENAPAENAPASASASASAENASASASAASSPAPVSSASPEASIVPAVEEAPQQEPEPSPAASSPAPVPGPPENAGPASAQQPVPRPAGPRAPNAPAPAEDPVVEPPPEVDQPVEVEIPEVEIPDF